MTNHVQRRNDRLEAEFLDEKFSSSKSFTKKVKFKVNEVFEVILLFLSHFDLSFHINQIAQKHSQKLRVASDHFSYRSLFNMTVEVRMALEDEQEAVFEEIQEERVIFVEKLDPLKNRVL